MENYVLYHHGVKGMKWGVRKKVATAYSKYTQARAKAKRERAEYLDDKYSDSVLNRKTSLRERVDEKKHKVDRSRREADERIKFYGGKSVAKNAIQQEANYATKVEVGKGAARSALSAVGGFTLATVTFEAGASAAATAACLTGGGIGIVAAGVMAAKAVSAIKQHANEQIAYTDDSTAGKDIIVKNVD